MRILTLAAALLLLASPAPGQERIADGVLLFPGQARPGIQPDGNSILLRGPEGWILFDTGRHASHTGAVLAHLRESGAPLVAVVNSHWHLDHVGGNPRIRAAWPEARVYATPALNAALDGFLADYRRQLETAIPRVPGPEERARLQAELAILDQAPALSPDVDVNEAGSVEFAGRRLELGIARHAVTAADLWLLDEATGVLLAGDLVTLPAPFLDTACLRGWRAALAELAATGFERLVPGHGPVLDRAGLEAYRAAFGGLLDCAGSERPAEACIDGWLREAGPLVPASEELYARELLSYYLAHHLRGNEERQAELCGRPAGVD